jgi:prepilin-type N-terminal cleavage/methylation domain-containing protein
MLSVVNQTARGLNSIRRSGHRSRRRRGMGLVELMISLALAATLLTAVGAALDASFKSYRVNEEQSSLIQRTRLTLNRITTAVRTSKLHQPHTASLAANFAGGFTVVDTGLDMFNSNGVAMNFYYDAPNQRVLATYNGTPHVLAEGVTAFQMTLEPMRSAESLRTAGGCDLLRRATVLMSIKTVSHTAQGSETTGKQVLTLSASVMPRRNAW